MKAVLRWNAPAVRRPSAGVRHRSALAVAAAGFLLLGCGDGPSDPRVPRVETAAVLAPVILIPGAEASTLVTADDKSMWSGSLLHFLRPGSFERLSRPLAPGTPDRQGTPLRPADIIRGMLGQDYYAAMIASLERRAGGECTLPEAIRAETRCVLFPWDWRLDLSASAARLDRVIERMRAVREDPRLRVDLVGHSAGGVVARYFVRFGGRDVLDEAPEQVRVDFAGISKVRRVALIGVPNEGTVYGLQLMMRGHGIGLVELRPELIAVMPAAYQVLPHPDRSWLIDSHGRPLDRDLYDPDTWRALGQSVFDPEVARRVREGEGGERRLADLERFFADALERGRRLHLALSRPVAEAFGYDVFAGDCLPTPARFVEERVDGRARLRFSPAEIEGPRPGVDYGALMQRPGDGWVTWGSALGRDTGRPTLSVRNLLSGCMEHASMAAAAPVRHGLLGLLALADVEGPARGPMTLSREAVAGR